MQLGMIGLGRMGANMVRRLMRGGHAVRRLRRPPGSGEAAGRGEGDRGRRRSTTSSPQLEAAPRRLADGAGRRGRPDARADLAPRLDAGDIIIDGGNSYYIDDIRARAGADGRGGIHYVDVGTSGGVWGLERGYCLMIGGEADVVQHLDPIFATLAPGVESVARTPGREKVEAAPRSTATCTAAPSGAGHFVKMVHNGIEYGLMAAYAEGFNILRARQRRQARRSDRRRDDAAAQSRALPVRPQPARRRRGVAARQRGRLVAPRPDRDRAARATPTSRTSRAASRTPARAAGRSRPPSTRACRRHVLDQPRSSSASPRGARPTSPTRLLSAMRFEFGGHVEKADRGLVP